MRADLLPAHAVIVLAVIQRAGLLTATGSHVPAARSLGGLPSLCGNERWPGLEMPESGAECSTRLLLMVLLASGVARRA